MAKYRAKQDLPPNIKAGDIVETENDLIPEYVPLFERVGEDEEVSDKTVILNPSRDELKARANELGINFASNIPTERLMELVKEAEEKKAAEDGEGGGDGDGEE